MTFLFWIGSVDFLLQNWFKIPAKVWKIGHWSVYFTYL